MSKKYFIVSDVHGFYSILKTTLANAGFDPTNPEHVFVSCGDLFDRGPEAVKLLDYVLALPNKILIAGNHDIYLQRLLTTGELYGYDLPNGTWNTACQLADVSLDEDALNPDAVYCTCAMAYTDKIKAYFRELIFYAQLGNFVLTHAWLPHDSKGAILDNWEDANSSEWLRATQDQSPKCWAHYADHPMFGANNEPIKVVCGHWHATAAYVMDGTLAPEEEFTTDMTKWKMYDNHNIIALDMATVFTQKMECLVLEAE